jgi:hypothetical protein
MVQTIDLSANNLDGVPDSIWNLVHMTELNLVETLLTFRLRILATRPQPHKGPESRFNASSDCLGIAPSDKQQHCRRTLPDDLPAYKARKF